MSDTKTHRRLARKEQPVFAGRGAGFHSPNKYDRTQKYRHNYLPEPDDEIVDIWDRPVR